MPQEPKFGAENMMVPGPVPSDLQGLTMLEKQLMITRSHPIARVYRKKGGQYRYSGDVLNTSQDIATFATSLLWYPDSSEIPNIIIRPAGGGTWHGRISRDRVQRALTWLIANSLAYADICLNVERVSRLGPVGGPEVDQINNFLHINEPDENGDDGDTEVDNDSADGRRDYRGVGAPGPDNDHDVDDPQDTAGAWTRPPRPPRASCPQRWRQRPNRGGRRKGGVAGDRR